MQYLPDGTGMDSEKSHQTNLRVAGSSYSTHITDGERWRSVGNPKNPIIKEEKVSKAMRAYLERAQQHGNYELDLVAQPEEASLHNNRLPGTFLLVSFNAGDKGSKRRGVDEFMKKQLLDYNIGKRHLANMMGEDPETFTQKDIDVSQPKHSSQLINAYPGTSPVLAYHLSHRPNQLLIVDSSCFPVPSRPQDPSPYPLNHLNQPLLDPHPSAIQYLFPSGIFSPAARPLMKHPDEVFPPRKAAEFDESGRPHHFLFYTSKPNFYQVNLTGSQWLPKEQLEKLLVESLSDKDYQNFIVLMDRLVEHPYSYRVKSFYEAYRKPLLSQTKTYDIPKPLYDADGRAYVTTKECLRKTARGEVTLRSPGTGKIQINGEGVDYFKDNQPREQLLFPLVFTGLLGAVDVEATVTGGGSSGQAGAIRWGISWGLRSFVDQEMVEKMRLAGLLTRDYRKKERKKPGQEGARRKYTWRKR
uniref:Small ribosomal subunit protein uS9m n=1 Tax=Timema douglasi TaxID=61478 RepID=A0A7R8VA33_TIMDO|nr:unnamed protein product [Timema douglasi]